MSQQEKIEKLQNEPEMLNCQYAARYYYNRAEGYSIVAIVCSLLSVLCLFIPDSLDKLGLLLPSVLDLLAFILYFLMGKSITSAALLRNHFDNTVLGFSSMSNSNPELLKIHSHIFRAITKNSEKYEMQISSTGKDNPPGVRNWYEFPKDYPDADVVYECQKQNQWWNKEIYKRDMLVFSLTMAITIIGIILICIFTHSTWYKICACLLSYIITFSDRIIENWHYFRASIEIENTCNILSTSRSKQQIRALQDKIEYRRNLRVTELNIMHKKKSNKLSTEYAYISKGT